MNRIAAIGVLVVLSGPLGFAQSSSAHPAAGQERQAKELEQQWSELRQKDPAGWEKFKASTVLDMQQALAEFGYGTVFTAALDDKTKAALRNYQGRNGLEPTGDVDVHTWMRLQEDKSALERKIPVGPVYKFLDSDWSQLVKVEGIWVEQGKEPDANTRLETAVVECLKSARLCILANSDGSGTSTSRGLTSNDGMRTKS